jgi:hypothetical protein
MKKKLLITIVALTLAVSAFAQQYASETDFQYGWDKNVKDGIEITKYVGKQTEIRIPPTIQNHKVTSIGNSAFRNMNTITSITIPTNVISIEGGTFGGAFQGCTSLASVTIPSTVTTIGQRAFSGCTSLANVTIPNSVTKIENDVFNGCTKLARVTIGSGTTTIGARGFNGCTSLASITIPRSVTAIGVDAFKDCTNLTSVTIQSNILSKDFGGVTSIGGVPVGLFPGDLAKKYLDRDGGPGTYIRFANQQEWRKQ